MTLASALLKGSMDTVEFFNLILGTKLTPQEKKDLLAFVLAL